MITYCTSLYLPAGSDVAWNAVCPACVKIRSRKKYCHSSPTTFSKMFLPGFGKKRKTQRVAWKVCGNDTVCSEMFTSTCEIIHEFVAMQIQGSRLK